MSSREAAIAALHAAISTALAARSPTPQVLRGETVPQRLTAGGLVMIQDGETVEETAILSPLRWQVRHVAEVAVAAPGVTPEARAAALDALLVDIAAAVVADRRASVADRRSQTDLAKGSPSADRPSGLVWRAAV